MRLHLLLLAFWLPALASAAAAEETIVATVSSRLEAPSAVLPGQRVIYEVEILSNALSFQGLRVVPPAVSGGLLLSDAAATVKGTRRVAGETLQYVSYRFPVYPQRPGSLRITAATVSFTASLGYGLPSRDFRLEAAGQVLSVAALPRAVPLAATELSVSAAVDPEGSVVRVGDARALTITRRLEDAPALLLDPIALPPLPGVAVYPGTPEVIVESARGRLTGVRRDRFTLVFEAPGSVELPAFRFPWWDPAEGLARFATLPALSFEVAGAPADGSAGEGGGAGKLRLAVGALLAVSLLAVVVVVGCRGAAVDGPRQRLAALRRAARRNDPRAAHAAFLRWQAGAAGAPSGALAPALRELEDALVAGCPWDGRMLRRALRESRRHDRGREPALVELNPGS